MTPRGRAVALAVGLAVVAGVTTGTGGASAQTTTSTPSTRSAPSTAPGPAAATVAVRTPTAADPLRVLTFGDSVMATAYPGIDAALRATGVARAVDAHAPAFGLTSLYDWRAEWPAVLRRERPDVILLLFGGWDIGVVRLVGPAYYDLLLDEALAMMRTTGALVVFIGSPTTEASQRNEPGRRLMNGFFVDAARRAPGDVAYLAPEPVLDDALGNFRRYAQAADGTWERLRKKDDVHLCAPGAARVGAAVVDLLRSRGVALPALAGDQWQHGSWTKVAVYESDPIGACDRETPAD